MSYKLNPGDARRWSFDAGLSKRFTEATLHELCLVLRRIPDFDHNETASVVHTC